MATQHPSSALRAPAPSLAYPMAKPGYGKRSAPHQLPRTPDDFALLSTRDRYVAGFVDHLPEGAAMSVKSLAKQLPLYGQQAISTTLKALSVAGHLRRVRCAVGEDDETRWAFRTFWSRTARDNEWWNAYLAAENTRHSGPAAPAAAPGTATPPPPRGPAAEGPPPAPPESPRTEAAPEPSEHAEPATVSTAPTASPTAVPHQRTPAETSGTTPGPVPITDPDTAPATPRSAAYLALAQLGRNDHRLPLSAEDCAALEAQAAQWLARGVTADYLITALTAGLPARVDSPVGFVRRRLRDKIPAALPAGAPVPGTPARRVLMECTGCGAPGRPEALPDGLCRPCRAAHHPEPAPLPAPTPADAPDIGAHIAALRDLLKAP